METRKVKIAGEFFDVPLRVAKYIEELSEKHWSCDEVLQYICGMEKSGQKEIKQLERIASSLERIAASLGNIEPPAPVEML